MGVVPQNIDFVSVPDQLDVRGVQDQPLSDSSIPYPSSQLYIVAGTLLPALGTVATALRFVVRVKKEQGFAADDWLVLPALVSTAGHLTPIRNSSNQLQANFWAMSICIILGWSHHVFGYPSPPSPEPDNPNFQVTGSLPGQVFLQRVEYVFYIFMIVTFGFIKLAVICFYRRVFVVGSSTFGKVTIAGIVISIVWTVLFFFLQVFECGSSAQPYFGPLGDQLTQCLDGLKFLISLAVTDLATDIFIFFMPIPLVWALHLSPRKKVAVTFVLCLGAVSIAASAIRLSTHVGQVVAGQIEAGVALIAINLPIVQTSISGKTVTSVVGSIRSVISLASLSSGRTGSNGTRTKRNGSDQGHAAVREGIPPERTDRYGKTPLKSAADDHSVMEENPEET